MKAVWKDTIIGITSPSCRF